MSRYIAAAIGWCSGRRVEKDSVLMIKTIEVEGMQVGMGISGWRECAAWEG